MFKWNSKYTEILARQNHYIININLLPSPFKIKAFLLISFTILIHSSFLINSLSFLFQLLLQFSLFLQLPVHQLLLLPLVAFG